MSNRSLIETLSREAETKTRSPWVGAIEGIAFSLVFFLLIGWFHQLRPDLMEKIHDPWYLINLILLGFSALLSATISCWIAIPNLRSPRWMRLVAFIPAVGWALSLVLMLYQTWLQSPALIHPQEMDMFCVQNFMLFLLLPGAFQLYQIKRLAPVLPAWSGALAILFATSTGNFALMLLEQNDAIYHQFAWHLIPTALFTMLGYAMGPRLLKW